MSLKSKFFDATVKADGGYIPRPESFWYALGIAGQNISYGLVANWFYYYCTDVAHYKLGVIGFVLTFARIWDAFNDPIGGMLIDRHRFKNGEKLRPWLRYAPLIAGTCSLLMFVTPGAVMSSTALQGAYMLLIYLVYDMSYTVQDVSQWGMTAVMTPDPDERNMISQIGRIGATVGGWLPGLISVIIPIGTKIMSEKALFALLGIFLGLGGMLLAITASKAQERVRTPAPTKSEGVFEQFGDLFKNRIVMCILISSILGGLSIALPQTYFFKYKVAMTIAGHEFDGLTLNFIYGLLCGLPGTVAILFVNAAAKRFGGMKNIYIFSYVLPVFARIICFFVGYQGWKIAIVLVVMAIAGIPGGFQGTAQTALFGDSIDLMEYKTGRRSEAMIFAAQTFCAKIGTALNNAICTAVLASLDYSAEAYDQGQPLSEKFDKWAWPLFILGPIIGLVGNIVPMLFIRYPASMKREVEEELKRRRALAEKEGKAQAAEAAEV